MQNCQCLSWRIFLLMRIGLLPVALIMCLAGVSYAKPADGQDVLKRKISLNADQEQMKLVLRRISKKADVKFIYISPKVEDQRRVTIVAENDELGQVLNRLLRPFNIQYEVFDDQIILKPGAPIAIAGAPVAQTGQPITIKRDSVSGKVTDESGNPVPAASVTVQGSANGVSTDKDGNFSLDADLNDVLVISAIGYESVEITIGRNAGLVVVLKKESTSWTKW